MTPETGSTIPSATCGEEQKCKGKAVAEEPTHCDMAVDKDDEEEEEDGEEETEGDDDEEEVCPYHCFPQFLLNRVCCRHWLTANDLSRPRLVRTFPFPSPWDTMPYTGQINVDIPC
jgi:hypothetical protein